MQETKIPIRIDNLRQLERARRLKLFTDWVRERGEQCMAGKYVIGSDPGAPEGDRTVWHKSNS
jgi:hypothetical protein